jgi:hypothetical protein
VDFVNLQRRHEEAGVERITEVGRLAILVGDISYVLVYPSMPPIPGISQAPCTTGNIL